MNFTSEGGSILSLLNHPRIYKIPRFQREFSWDKGNYKEFLDDMLEQITFSNNKFSTSQYYLGNMLFLGENNNFSVEVVDGQQRLTTITILLAVIRDYLFELNSDKSKAVAETTQEYLVKIIDGEAQRKIQTVSSYPYFTQTIQDYHTANPRVEAKTDEEKLLNQTFEYFKKRLKEKELVNSFNKIKKTDVSNDLYMQLLVALRDQVLTSEVINIFSSDKVHVNRIFQNINSKGKSLSQVDLIKNELFSKIGKTLAGVDELAHTWQDILGKLNVLDVSINEFFFHFWKANYPSDRVKTTTLYKKYIDKFGAADETQIKAFIRLLEDSLRIYCNIIKPDKNAYTRQQDNIRLESFNALNEFHGVQIRIVLLLSLIHI